MKRREFLIKLGALGLMSMAPALSGCAGSNMDNTQISPAPATATPAMAQASSSTTTTVDSLARTCPKGKRCTSPQCGQWSDLNGDNRCDRGYF